jgi:hypothetical protein
MNAYTNKLVEMGIAESRVAGLNDAMDKLNSELCKLDLAGLRAFGKQFGIIGHLDQYAQATGDRNVARELYQAGLNRAVKNIDFDEFPEFSDKLFYLTEQAAEMNLPGASMLCKSLVDIRRGFENRKKPFAKFAAKMNHIGFINGPTSREELTCHVSGPYNSCNRHLNDEQIVGYATRLKTYERHEHESGDSGYDMMFIKVDSFDFDAPRDIIIQAIKHIYEIDSCGHDWDCCGCRRQSVTHVKYLAEVQCSEIFAVKISWHLCR